MRKLNFVLILAVIPLAFTGCLKTGQSSGSIGVNPDTVTVALGSTQAFTAITTGNLAGSGVSWKVAGGSCSGSNCGTIDSNGNYTAPTTAPSNPQVQVIATSTADNTESGVANVTIAGTVAISITTKPANLAVGAGQQLGPFDATVTNTTNTTVNWSVSGTGCSGIACGTLSAASTPDALTPVSYLAPTILPNPATVAIKATSAADPTKSATVNVTVILFVQVAPALATVGTNSIQVFTSTVVGSSNQAVTWSVSGAGCSGATCGTITAGGDYTAPPVVPSPPTVTVTALAAADNATTGTATVTINVGGVLSELSGHYAFVYRTVPVGAASPVVEAGSLFFDGAGHVIAPSVEDDNNGTTPHLQQSITGSYAFDIGDNTRGTITLLGGLVTKLSFALEPNSGSTVAKTVFLNDFTGTRVGGGKMLLQDTTKFLNSTLANGYAVSLRGGTNNSLAIATFQGAVGRFDISSNTISHGELGRGFDDANFGVCAFNPSTGSITGSGPSYTAFSGSVSSVNASTGNSTFTLNSVNMGGGTNTNFASATPVTIGQMKLSAYIVDATRIVLVEIDTNGYAFLGSAEQQSTNSFGNTSLPLSQTYTFLMQSNSGPGAGNVVWSPITIDNNTSSPTQLDDGEYTGNLNGQVFYGSNYGIDTLAMDSYYQMVNPNGLALMSLCTGFNQTKLVMYFISPNRAFIWSPNATINSNTTPNPNPVVISDTIGEIDLQTGGPYGGSDTTKNIAGTYAFEFEGVNGSFSMNGHTSTSATAETGLAIFGTPTVQNCTTVCAGGVQQVGSLTLTFDEADSSETVANVVITGTYSFNNDNDGDDDANTDQESIGSLTFTSASVNGTPVSLASLNFKIPDHFDVVSNHKILLLYDNGLPNTPTPVSNVAGIAENNQ